MTRRTSVILAHGYNDAGEGKGNVDLLIPSIEGLGLKPVEVNYGLTMRLGVRLCNKRMSSALSKLVPKGSIGIGHSNGATLLWLAANYGASFKRLILVNPALDSNVSIPKQLERVDVFYDPKDPWPSLARFIPFSPWGAMGTRGYNGPDKRVFNHKHHYGHSGLFRCQPDRIIQLI